MLAACNTLAQRAHSKFWAKKAANKPIVIVYHAQNETSIQCASATKSLRYVRRRAAAIHSMAQQVARTLRRLGTPEALTGAVVHGFGRGSAQLGFPTANLEIDWTDGAKTPAAQRIRTFVDTHDTGIYAAWAQVADGDDSGVQGGRERARMERRGRPVSVAAMARARARAVDAPLGRRHFGDLERKTVEAWLLHDFAAVIFYGRTLSDAFTNRGLRAARAQVRLVGWFGCRHSRGRRFRRSRELGDAREVDVTGSSPRAASAASMLRRAPKRRRADSC